MPLLLYSTPSSLNLHICARKRGKLRRPLQNDLLHRNSWAKSVCYICYGTLFQISKTRKARLIKSKFNIYFDCWRHHENWTMPMQPGKQQFRRLRFREITQTRMNHNELHPEVARDESQRGMPPAAFTTVEVPKCLEAFRNPSPRHATLARDNQL